MGGVGKKKFQARENAKKKKLCKEEGKEKNIHTEGKSDCDLYLIYKICQYQFSFKIFPGPYLTGPYFIHPTNRLLKLLLDSDLSGG